MQYETIILELLSRIKALEDEVAAIRQRLDTMSAAPDDEEPAGAEAGGSSDTAVARQKISDEMIVLCYKYGKKLHAGENIADLVDSIEEQTGMNRNSAIMALYVVSAMLSGTIYKRGVSTKATKMYFDEILNEYGNSGLKKALQATKLHITYRKECGQTVTSIERLYDQYIQRL